MGHLYWTYSYLLADWSSWDTILVRGWSTIGVSSRGTIGRSRGSVLRLSLLTHLVIDSVALGLVG